MPVKVLLIDDEQGFSSTLGERLVLRDFEVRVAGTGGQALACARDQVPDVVLLDLFLPDMPGEEVLDALKEIDASMEVIVMSGRCLTDEAQIKGSPFGCVTKPVKLVELVELINEAYQAVCINRQKGEE